MLFLTPDSLNWKPYSEHFASNEESMLDWEGHIQDKRYRKKHIIAKDFSAMIDSVMVSAFNATATSDDDVAPYSNRELEYISKSLNSRAEVSKFSASIGCTSKFNEHSCDLFQPILTTIEEFKADIDSALASKPKTISPEFLSKVWHIKPNLTSKVLNQTTQLQRQGADNSLSRHYSTNDWMLRYKRINSQFFTDTFFVTAKGKSTRGNICAQIFVSDKGFVAIYPMKTKGDFLNALHQFCKEIGVPPTLVVDPAGEQTSKEVKKFCHQVGATLKIIEESTQWANRAELYVGLFKKSIRQDLNRSDCPMILWDYCDERRARIHNVTLRDLFQLNDLNPITATFGIEGDISNICQFDWYEWCYYREESHVQSPFQKNAS